MHFCAQNLHLTRFTFIEDSPFSCLFIVVTHKIILIVVIGRFIYSYVKGITNVLNNNR